MTGLLLVAALATAPPPPAVGRDVLIDTPTVGTVVSVAAAIKVISEVDGDVVALAGDIELAATARVSGDVVALGGTVSGDGVVGGRSVGVAALSTSGLPGSADVRARWGLFLARAGGWVVLVTMVLLLAPAAVRRVGESLARLGAWAPAIGLAVVAVWLVVMVLALVANARPLGKAMVVIAVLGLLGMKVLGLTVVAWAVGRWLARGFPLSLRGELPRAGIASFLLVAAGTLPLVGGVVWALANVVGVGAAVSVFVPGRGVKLPSAARIPR